MDTHTHTFAASCTAIAALSLLPQAPLPPQAESLRRVAPAVTQADRDEEAAAWRKRLSNEDLAARELDFEALIDRALASDDARLEVEAWSNDREHLEFAWTCRLALREAQARAQASEIPADPFEAMRRHMFGGFQMQPLDLWTVDPLGRGWGRIQPFDPADPFRPAPGVTGEMRSQGFSLEMGQGGVKARLKKQVDGQETVEEYSAKTVDELLQAHPELKEHFGGVAIGGDFGSVLRLGLPGFQLDHDFAPRIATVLRTDRLGVYIQAEQQDGGGLRIEAVQPGSLAERLGLETGQVLLKLNGRELRSRDDISDVLKSRDKATAIDVEVRGTDGTISTKSWTPSTDPRGEARPLVPGAGTKKV
jgi:hypothetical protein